MNESPDVTFVRKLIKKLGRENLDLLLARYHENAALHAKPHLVKLTRKYFPNLVADLEAYK